LIARIRCGLECHVRKAKPSAANNILFGTDQNRNMQLMLPVVMPQVTRHGVIGFHEEDDHFIGLLLERRAWDKGA